MKKLCFFLLAICLLRGTAYEKEQVIECKLCPNLETLEILKDEDAKIIKMNFPDNRVDSFYIELKRTYTHSIIPYDILSQKYRKVGLDIKVSGIVTEYFMKMYKPNLSAKFSPINIFILTKIK